MFRQEKCCERSEIERGDGALAETFSGRRPVRDRCRPDGFLPASPMGRLPVPAFEAVGSTGAGATSPLEAPHPMARSTVTLRCEKEYTHSA